LRPQRHTMASQFPFSAPGTPGLRNHSKLDIERAYQQALALHRAGQIQNAANLYQQILSNQPNHAGSLHMLGVVALSSGAFAQARQLLSNALPYLPKDAGLRVNLALALAECEQIDEALQRIDEALALNPAMPAARINRLALLVKASQYEAALQEVDALAAAGIAHPEIQINRGVALLELERNDEAAQCLRQVLRTHPGHAKAHNNLAKALVALKQLDAAADHARRALAAQPHYPDATSTLARALTGQRKFTEAEQVLRKTLTDFPPTVALLLDHASCLLELRRFSGAITQVEKALALDPQSAPAYTVGGQALAAQGRFEDAIGNFDKALSIDPDLHAARYARAASEINLKRFAAAIADLKACGTDASTWLPIQMQICDWQDYVQDPSQLEAIAEENQRNPFPYLAMLDSPAAHLRMAQAHLHSLDLQQFKTVEFAPHRPGKIRVGYFSADYFHHATTHLMMELLDSHDREQFEIHAFSMGPQRHDPVREKVVGSVDGFHDISGMTDAEAAALSRSLSMDIAVDLKGFTIDGRLGVFAERCAPIQVSYLGYPGTTGASYIDYVIADETVIPEEEQPHYTEKPVYMPYSYQVNNSQRQISQRQFTRTELGLPDDGFVFCCFNNNYKIVPEVFDTWMRILQRVPASVLWLFKDSDAAADNLRQAAISRGIAPDRLVFAGRLAPDEHLSRHSGADLFLDTWPYNAHTTASDALWAGLPVLTRAGRAFQARVAASLLKAVGLAELITHTAQDYEELAVQLATTPARLATYRAHLLSQGKQSPLFDGRRFTRDLESAYRLMLQQHQRSGAVPVAITVPRSESSRA
jgi:protein O-GlcNAc transferase